MKRAFQLCTAWGIPIRIHVSLPALMLVVGAAAWSMGGLPKMLMNLGLLIIVFASIALHELAHSLVAIRKGCTVREITLMFVGGAAGLEDIPRKPSAEIQIALAGPLFSLALAAATWYGGAHLSGLPRMPAIWGDGRYNLFQLAGQLNLTLALFNLLPAFPMDGGRIFRALMSRRIGYLPATFVASRLGRLAAIVMCVLGAAHHYLGLFVIAIFLFRAAGREFDEVLQQEFSEGARKLADRGKDAAA